MTAHDEQTEALRQAVHRGIFKSYPVSVLEAVGYTQGGYDALLDSIAAEVTPLRMVTKHVSSHPDMETVARLQSEGYEMAMTQHLADDPTAADDWLEARIAQERAKWEAERPAPTPDAISEHERDPGKWLPGTPIHDAGGQHIGVVGDDGDPVYDTSAPTLDARAEAERLNAHAQIVAVLAGAGLTAHPDVQRWLALLAESPAPTQDAECPMHDEQGHATERPEDQLEQAALAVRALVRLPRPQRPGDGTRTVTECDIIVNAALGQAEAAVRAIAAERPAPTPTINVAEEVKANGPSAINADIRTRLTTALVENGVSTDGANGDDGIHSWRCAYDKCDCFANLLDDLEKAVER